MTGVLQNTSAVVSCSTQQPYSTKEELSNLFMSRGKGLFSYQFITPRTPSEWRDTILNSAVGTMQEPKDESKRAGILGSVRTPWDFQLTKENLTGRTQVIFFDLENGIDEGVATFNTPEEVFNFIQKTYRLTPIGVRQSTSGTHGKWHAWVLLDRPIDLDQVKHFIHKKTPDQQRIRMYNKKTGEEQSDATKNPYIDISVYSGARPSYSIREREWLLISDTTNDARTITMALPKLKEQKIPEQTPRSERKANATKHRKSLKMTPTAYRNMTQNSQLHPMTEIYTIDGTPVKVGDAKADHRYSRVQHFRSPSFHCQEPGVFFDFRTRKRYTILDLGAVHFYDRFITESGFDFDAARTLVVHAATGSAKTTAFNKRKTLIAVPRVDQATHNAHNTKQIVQATHQGAVFITHDKLLGHIRNTDLMTKLVEQGTRIVIDEAHLLPKNQKFEPLYQLDAIFLSGTLPRYFREDLPHIHFYPRGGAQTIKLATEIPKAAPDVHTLYFYEDAALIVHYFPTNALIGKENQGKFIGGYSAQKILTRSAAASSAIFEGITIEVEPGSKWRVVVVASNLHDIKSHVQACNRIRDPNTERIIIVTHPKKLLDNTETSIDIAQRVAFLDSKGVGRREAFLGAGAQIDYYHRVYSSSNYKSVSTFGLVAHTMFKDRNVLPDLYNYEILEVTDPEEPRTQKAEQDPGFEKEEEWIHFKRGDQRCKTNFKGAARWEKAFNSGLIYDIVTWWKTKHLQRGTLITIRGLQKKFKNLGVIKPGHELEPKELVQALGRLVKIELRKADRITVQKRFGTSVEFIRIVADCPFDWQPE